MPPKKRKRGRPKGAAKTPRAVSALSSGGSGGHQNQDIHKTQEARDEANPMSTPTLLEEKRVPRPREMYSNEQWETQREDADSDEKGN